MKNLVIMAGGMSRRMGQDKVFLRFNGGSFLECVYKNALVCFDNIFISTDCEEHACNITALPGLKGIKKENIILDRYPRCGPIGGICSVFDSTEIDKFAIIPTDVPNADMRVLETLFDLCGKVPCVFKRADGELEKLVGAYPRECYDAFKKRMEMERYSIMKALEASGFETFSRSDLIKENSELEKVDFDNAFNNINRPEDYEKLVKGSNWIKGKQVENINSKIRI